MKKLLAVALLALPTLMFCAQLSQPQTQPNSLFQELKIKTSQGKSPDVLCIFVPDQKAPRTETDWNLYQAFFSQLRVPANFFGASQPIDSLTPTVVVFDWVDNEGPTNLKNSASAFVDALQSSLRKQISKAYSIVLIGAGRGGLLINMATNLPTFKTALKTKTNNNSITIINIGTPLPQQASSTNKSQPGAHQASKIKRNLMNEQLTPKPDSFAQFFNFYSNHAYTHTYPGNQTEPSSMKPYQSTKNFKPYNILLLINNQQPSFQKDVFLPQKQTTCELLGKNLLPLCQAAQAKYAKFDHSSLWGSINNKDQQTPSNVMLGEVIKKNTGQLSGINSQNYDAFWGPGALSKALNLSDGQKWRKQYSISATSTPRVLQQLTHQAA